MDEIDLLSPTSNSMSADEAQAIPGGIVTKQLETVAALDTTTITTAVATAAATTIEEQLARLHQRQDDQTQLLSELRSRVIELEAVIQNMKQGGGGTCNGGGGAERKRNNDEANPPLPNPAAAASTTTSTITTTHHPSDGDHHPSSSSLLINNNGANIADKDERSMMPPATIATDDDEITNILASRRERNLWPLKRKYCTSFSRELDLMKLRFHQSNRYPHKTVRIPKQQSLATATPTNMSTSATAETQRTTSVSTAADTILTTTATSSSYSSSASLGHEVACSSNNNSNNSSGNYRYGSLGNKEGRLICRLCSGKTMNRNTSWMCGTCIVPLCIDIVDGNPNSSCFAKWHRCKDLIMENLVLNGELRERRTMKKQRTTSTSDGGGGGNTKFVMVRAEQESNLPISGEDPLDSDAAMI